MRKNLLQMIRESRRKISYMFGLGEDTNDAQLNLSSLILEGSSNINEMSQSAGWELLTDILLAEIRNKIKRIYRLSSDPDKNRNEIMELRGTCEAITEILSTVNKWKDKQKLVRDEIKNLVDRSVKT